MVDEKFSDAIGEDPGSGAADVEMDGGKSKGACLAADEHDGQAIFYTFEAGCWPATLANTSGLQTWNNSFFSPNAAFAGYPTGCGWNFSTWQAHGQDSGSRVAQTPSVEAIVAMGLAALEGEG